MGDHHGWLRSVLIAILLMLGFALKGSLIDPPSPPPHAAPGTFDTKRALDRLQRILGDQRPHPVDSADDDAVRDRLMAELRAIGLDPQVHEAVDCSGFPKSRVVSCSHVRNVVATIPGRTPAKHLLLNAHYDSTPTGPGAGDDGFGVATLLEVGAHLKADPPARPVTLLFNEGEEFGLNGAAAFVRTDPLAKQVNSLINIDTRGVTGGAVMYETSDPNGAAMVSYAQATKRPFANSLSTDFAKLIPNTTDVVKFRPAGWTLLNYGIIGNETRYHSPGDRVEALNPASLYHLGSEVLALTRILADTSDPASAGSGRDAFVDIADRFLFRLSLPVAAGALAILVLAGFYFGWRERALAKPIGVAAGMTVAGVAAAAFISFLATLARPGDFWRAYPLVSYLAVYAVMLAAMMAVWGRWGIRIDRRRLRAAAWLFILILGGLMSIFLPGATIFFLIAPAIALAGIAIYERSPQVGILLAVIATLVQFVMFAELLAGVELLLIDGPLWAVAPFGALAALPALAELDDSRPRPAVALLVVASIGLWAAALLLPRMTAERPESFSIDYFRDLDRKTASWGIASKQAPLPKGYPGQWHSGVLAYNARTRWIADAPLLDTTVPSAKLISSEPAGAGRRLRIALSPGGGNTVAIRFPKDAKVIALGLPGRPEAIPQNGEPPKAMLRCTGRSCEGLVIEAMLGDRKPVEAELLSYRFGLPAEGQPLQAARPRDAIPQYAPDSTIALNRIKL
jgi:hypothetical protein